MNNLNNNLLSLVKSVGSTDSLSNNLSNHSGSIETAVIIGLVLYAIGFGLYHYHFNWRVQVAQMRMAQTELARAQDNLPESVEISPQDLAANPELAEILGITEADVGNNLNVTLQTQEQLEFVDLQLELFIQTAQMNRMELGEAQLMNVAETILNAEYTTIYIYIFDTLHIFIIDIGIYFILVSFSIYEICIGFCNFIIYLCF
jgi:hypothetical protein